MGVRKVRPTSNARRQLVYSDFSDVTSGPKVKGLLMSKKATNGRNNTGKITIRHRGGGVKRMVRVIDFKRNKFDIPATVKTIEYDPGRGGRIALLSYADGEKRYIVAPDTLKVGDKVLNSQKEIEIKVGNTMPVQFIPAGIEVNCVELEFGKGAKVARSAGNSVMIMGVEGKYAQLKMPSGEIRLVFKNALCTIGKISNPDLMHITFGKAGRMRNKGWRPATSGKAMNPNDHPHGGGEGHQPIGLKGPKTKWGKPARGVKTRVKQSTDKFIVQRRNKNRKRK
jgi:large subunit ribosomal protein L2